MQLASTSKVLPSILDSNGSGLGFGCMSLAALYNNALTENESMELLKTVYDAGCRHFDTAEIYKTGAFMKDAEGDIFSESLMRPFLQTVPRESYTVATKYMPYKYDSKCDYASVRKALGNSLERLGLDYVDLYYCHRIPSLEKAIEFCRSAKKLKDEGLIRNVALSEISPLWLKKVHEEKCDIDAVQMEWSLLTRNIEAELVPLCKTLGITIVAYSPLARNLLASSKPLDPSDERLNLFPRFQGENYKKNTVLVSDVMGAMAEKYSCSPAQLALAWLFKRAKRMGVTVVPIPGTSNITHALSNAGATKIEISDESDVKVLEELSTMVEGERGSDSYVSVTFEAQT